MRGHPNSTTEGSFSAQSIIDAIIKHQISLGSSDSSAPNINRDLTRSTYYTPRHNPPAPATNAHSTANDISKNNSSNIINIDLDNERSNTNSHEQTSNNNARNTNRISGVSTTSAHAASQQQQQQQQPPTAPCSQSAPTPPQVTHTLTKNITFGELTDSIIASDYVTNALHMRSGPPPQPSYMPPYMQDAQGIVAPDRWKYNRRMQQKEVEKSVNNVNSGNVSSSVPVSVSGTVSANVSRASTPQDERNIIRMPMSPRKYVHDMILHSTSPAGASGPPPGSMPPASSAPHDTQPTSVAHYYHHAPPPPPPTSSSVGMHRNNGNPAQVAPHVTVTAAVSSVSGGSVVHNHHFDTMKYVKNRIKEVMRTEDDNRASSVASGSSSSNAGSDDHNERSNSKELYGEAARKTPNHYDERDNARQRQNNCNSSNSMSNHTNSNNIGTSHENANSTCNTSSMTTAHISHASLSAYPAPPVTTFAATTYAYPYSALNVPPPAAAAHLSGLLHGGSTSSVNSSLGGKTPASLGLGSENSSSGAVGLVVSGSSAAVSTSVSVPVSEPKPLLSAQYEALSDED